MDRRQDQQSDCNALAPAPLLLCFCSPVVLFCSPRGSRLEARACSHLARLVSRRSFSLRRLRHRRQLRPQNQTKPKAPAKELVGCSSHLISSRLICRQASLRLTCHCRLAQFGLSAHSNLLQQHRHRRQQAHFHFYFHFQTNPQVESSKARPANTERDATQRNATQFRQIWPTKTKAPTTEGAGERVWLSLAQFSLVKQNWCQCWEAKSQATFVVTLNSLQSIHVGCSCDSSRACSQL